MPTPIQIEAAKLLEAERKFRENDKVLVKGAANGAASLARVIGSATGHSSVGTGFWAAIKFFCFVLTEGPDVPEYEQELERVIRGERDTLPEHPGADGGGAHFA
jgi:hypothetical protein